MNREAYSKAELDAMHVEEILSEVIQVLRIADTISDFTPKVLEQKMSWPGQRTYIWTQLKISRLIESHDEIITKYSKWDFTPLALDYCRIFKKQTDRNWYRNCQANFDENVRSVNMRSYRGSIPTRALKINGKTHRFVYLPNGPESLLISLSDEHPRREVNTYLSQPAKPKQKKVLAITPPSRGELLAQGKPADVIRMLKPIDTAKALWVRAKCKLYERERRLPESLIQEAREILGIYAPSCVPRFGFSPA